MSDPYLPEGWTQDRIDDEISRQAAEQLANAAKCRSCGAPMIWAEAPNGKRVPVDFHPVPNGNILLADGGGKTMATYLRKQDNQPHVSVPRHVSHFATCAQAKEWRKS